MNGFDVTLLALACVLVVLGMARGLVRILIGVAALVAAFVLAARFHQPLADRLTFEIRPEALSLLAYVMIFLGVMLLGGAIAFFTRKLLKVAMLSWADRLGGAAVGLLAAALVAALVVLPLVAYSPWSEKLLAGSVLAPYVSVVADVANAVVPDSLSRRYRERIKSLRDYWRERWADPSDNARPVEA